MKNNKDKYQLISDLDAINRGRILAQSETLNVFLAKFLSKLDTLNDKDMRDRFYNTYASRELGKNIIALRKRYQFIIERNPVFLGGWSLTDLDQDLEKIRLLRNKMGHCIPDMSQETLHKSINELKIKSHSIYFNKENGHPEPLVLSSEDMEKALTLISLTLGKIFALEVQLFPGRNFPDFYVSGVENLKTISP